MKHLRTMTSAQLEREANKLLYGTEREPGNPKAPETMMGGFGYSRYFLPKLISEGKRCAKCSKPRHDHSAKFCRPCYLGNAKMRRMRYSEEGQPLELPEMAREDNNDFSPMVPVYRDYDESEE